MKDTIIKIRLITNKETSFLALNIIEQKECLRIISRRTKYKDITVGTALLPQLSSHAIYLRGINVYQDNFTCIYCSAIPTVVEMYGNTIIGILSFILDNRTYINQERRNNAD